jgi:Cu-processing system permease protein
MSAVIGTLARTQARDALRSRWLFVYTAFFLVVAEALLRFSAGDANAVVSLATVTFTVVPLGALVLSTAYVYNVREFTELLLAQPVSRSSVYAGLYLGLAAPLTGGFLAGVGLPLLARGGGDPALRGAVWMLLGVGAALTLAFTAISFLIALSIDDRLRGLGIALGLWLLAAVAYDGIVLAAVAIFSDRPIERPLLALMFANPADLGRVLVLLRLDVAALMGYTGAVFAHFFSGASGAMAAAAGLVFWIAAPITAGTMRFRRKDF